VFRELPEFKEALVSKVFRGCKASKAFKDLREIQEL
jgi:hypothetical protein